MKTLLHICCAPCSISCIEMLRSEGIEPVGYWNNPNIHPYTEYKSRRNALVEYADAIGLELMTQGAYGLRMFLDAVGADYEDRCQMCYDLRMDAAAAYARAHGFDSFTSTLFVSPYQNHEKLKTAAQRAAAAYEVEFLYRDFRPGFREGQNKARELGLYMQKYCGCTFSEEDRYSKETKNQKA